MPDPDLFFMDRLIALAHKYSDSADIPIAAAVVDHHSNIIAEAINAKETSGDPTAHAEILVLRKSAQTLGGYKQLHNCTLYVTIEPCTMCAGAINLARIDRIVFGAFEPKTGAAGSLWDALRDPRLNYTPAVRSGVRARECAQILREYFQHLRLENTQAKPPIT